MGALSNILSPVIPRNIESTTPRAGTETAPAETPATPTPAPAPEETPKHYKVKGSDYLKASMASGTVLGGIAGFAKGYFDTRNADFVKTTQTVNFNEQYLYGHKRDAFENEVEVVNGQKVVKSYFQDYKPDVRERQAGSYETTRYSKPDGVLSPLGGALLGMAGGFILGTVAGIVMYAIKNQSE
ncbi:MAG: hypothetical protein HYU64_13695 [Armatimonadetes bacterium]|nr:hypothetical protein [Armatimonadota bacterium]